MKKIIKSLTIAIFLVFITATPVSAQTVAWDKACIGSSFGISGAEDVATIQGIQCLLANILSTAITIIGLAGFIMIIWGSFKYLLSGGNSKHTESARSTITYAIIGLVVALSSIIILNLISAFTGVRNITQFIIPTSIENLPGN